MLFLNRLSLHTSRQLLICLLVVIFAFTLSACGKEEVILTYKDGGEVTRTQLQSFINVNQMFNPQMAEYFKDKTVQNNLLLQYVANAILADQASAEVKAAADKQIAEQMKQIIDYYNGLEGGLAKQLSDNNVKQEDIEYTMKISYYTMMSLQEKVSDEEIQTEYNRKLAAKDYDIATVSHILISLKDSATDAVIRTDEEALARANEVLGKLKAGGDFSALAKEYSDDPGSKDNGGTYEDAAISGWVEEFKNAARDLPLNTLSDPPVKTQFGYHVMKVDSRGTKSLEDVKEEIKNELSSQVYSKFAETELPGYILTNKLADEIAKATPTATPAATPEETSTPTPTK
jgi:foldase protein PrsA